MTVDGAFTGVRAVLPDRVAHDATVVWEDGIITEVRSRGPVPRGAVDGQGAWCLPGLVDLHSDGLEREIRPRPTAELPEGFALRTAESRLRGAGITTVFHGVAFEHNPTYGRTVELAVRQSRLLAGLVDDPHVVVDHRVLHRLDVREPAGFAALLAALPEPDDAGPPLVSLEDHTPGVGQFRDVEAMARAMAESAHHRAGDDPVAAVQARIAERDARLDDATRIRAEVGAMARAGRIRLLAHDVVDAAGVDDAVELGASIAEFPVSMEAAAAARERGLGIVLGAPNVLRGGSHSGNVAAEALVAVGLVDALASDYIPASLVTAAFLLARRTVVDLPTAVGLVSSGPARLAGLHGRGRLEVGSQADLALVREDAGGWPVVVRVVRAHDRQLLTVP